MSTISAGDFKALAEFAKIGAVNFLIPGPEQPLVDGIVDYFAEHAPEIQAFGPSGQAARMEGSKTFSKDFMKRHNIPTAAYENFSDFESASKYLDSISHNVVIKASGLAAGKGVIIPQTKEEAQEALKEIMLQKEFGAAGDEVVIEEFLEGDELSILTFSDGRTIASLPPAQDHKRIFDNDLGPNTGGMGTYAPTTIAPKDVIDAVHRDILQPTVDGMRAEGYEFKGVLFTGLMMGKDGAKVLEYNVRFGDPETQSLLQLMESDLAEVMVACAEGKLADVDLQVSNKSAATVVVAAGGYPGSYAKGVEMTLDPTPEGMFLFLFTPSLAIQWELPLILLQTSYSSTPEHQSQTTPSALQAAASLHQPPRQQPSKKQWPKRTKEWTAYTSRACSSGRTLLGGRSRSDSYTGLTQLCSY
jgi:phosphoribosylamine--glycine ligase